MLKVKYNPNDRFHFSAGLLVVGVIIGIILGFSFHSATLLVLCPVLSQYRWLINTFNRIIYSNQIESLDRLTNSAKLADKRDNYTVGRYRNSVIYTLDMGHDDYYLLSIDANGVSNTRNLEDLANEVGAAFHRPASLERLSNGVAVYRINLSMPRTKVNEHDF